MSEHEAHTVPFKLKLLAWCFIILATAAYAISLFFDFTTATQFFPRSGAFSVLLVVVLFFASQATGFFTGVGADNIDNMNHAYQRDYLTNFEGYLLITGTFVWGFGDWIVNLLNCGWIVC